MMEDCCAGKIDLILVKSISCLGRNTVQFLQACDMLNALHVEVYFDIEKLYISDPKAVKMLTIYASLYQHESESKSFATRWGIVTRSRDGSSKYVISPAMGIGKQNMATLCQTRKRQKSCGRYTVGNRTDTLCEIYLPC